MAVDACTPGTGSATAAAVSTGMAAFATVPEKLIDATLALTNVLVPTSMGLLSVALIAAVTISLYKSWLTDSGIQGVIADVFRVIVIATLALTALEGWSTYSKVIPSWFADTVRSKVSGGSSDVFDMIKLQTSSLESIYSHLSGFYDRESAPCGSPESGIGKWFTEMMDKISLRTLLASLSAQFDGFIFMLLTCIPFGIFIAVTLAMIYGNTVITLIGMIFGPPMIAMAPFAPMSWMVMSWVRFMISNSLTVALAYLVSGLLASTVSSSISALAPAMDSLSGTVEIILLGMTIGVLYLFGVWLMLQCDNIAQGLLSGAGAHGGGLFVAAYRAASNHRPAGRSPSTNKPADSKGGTGGGGGGYDAGRRLGTAVRGGGAGGVSGAAASRAAGQAGSG